MDYWVTLLNESSDIPFEMRTWRASVAATKAVISTEKNRTLDLISSYPFHVSASNVSIIYMARGWNHQNNSIFVLYAKILLRSLTLVCQCCFWHSFLCRVFFLNLQLLPGSNSSKCLVPTTNISTLSFQLKGFLESHSNFSHFMGTNWKMLVKAKT